MYVNGNVYRWEQGLAIQHICDDCLLPIETETIALRNLSGESWTHTRQLPPWHWWPDTMSGGYTCNRCGVSYPPSRP